MFFQKFHKKKTSPLFIEKVNSLQFENNYFSLNSKRNIDAMNGSISKEFILDQAFIEYLQCPICLCIPSPETAIEGKCCDSIFCERCCQSILQQQGTCPICHKTMLELNIKPIKRNNKLLYRIMQGIAVKCPLKCEWKGTIEGLNKHFETCIYEEINCPFSCYGCYFSGKKEEIDAHLNTDKEKHLEMAMKFATVYKNKQNKPPDNNLQGKVSVHQHILTLQKVREGYIWRCDGRKIFDAHCPLGEATNKCPRFRCEKCDYDLCTTCFYKYLKQ